MRIQHLGILVVLLAAGAAAAAPVGYYRQPAIHGDTVVFVAEGDLWKVPAAGGVARRLTSHPGDESSPAISPDGKTVAFVATYEGPHDVYTMPIGGGLPSRRTWGIDGPSVVGWAPSGDVLVATLQYSTLPNVQLVRVSPTGEAGGDGNALVPLAQAADGDYDDSGTTLYFTRLPFQGSHTKRYRGGMAQSIWRFADGDAEATELTGDYDGTSKRPMWWNGRVYFASDRDGTMNLWSMNREGRDLRQHTHHDGWDVQSPYLDGGRIVYQLGADLRIYDVASDSDRRVEITLDSDLDQMRERWIDEPMDWVSAVHPSPDGDRVVLTARGQVYVAPRRQGRLVRATHEDGVRYRQAVFSGDGKELIALSDASGEVEVWSVPANGVGAPRQLTKGGDVLRWEAVPSPDGKRIAHHDKNHRLWVLDVDSGKDRKIDESEIDSFSDLTWSPDSRWLAYVAPNDNAFARIKLYDAREKRTEWITTDRYSSYGPAWSPDGKWLYMLSDRNLKSIVPSPWGAYEPEPFLDKQTGIYLLALTPGERSPFAPPDELHPAESEGENEGDGDAKKGGGDKDGKKADAVKVEIDFEGLRERLTQVPVEPGNYGSLAVSGKALYWLSRPAGQRNSTLLALEISNEKPKPKPETVADKLDGYELSADGKRLLLRKDKALYVVDAKAAKADLDESKVDLSGWKLSIRPREEWRQMFVEAWRLERDYFYDPNMHGVDWKHMLDKYLPLVDRVTTRVELSDLMAQMVSELSALHTFVRSGDVRKGPEDVRPGSLGARLVRDAAAGGWRVDHVYRGDPDDLDLQSPLVRPGVGIGEGDVLRAIDGVATAEAPGVAALLRNKAHRQVLIEVVPADGGEPRSAVVEPLDLDEAENLRYREWEYTRRRRVEQRSDGKIGYVHLRAMTGRNFTEWAKGYYPVFERQGLIVDVRHNRGGNIDSWILSRLQRKPWFYWSQRVGRSPWWNMQYAFRGHMAALCDERTASDGEAFTEGFKRLGLGRVFGTRTWGGEIWLSSSNRLVDRGIATAAEYGVYGPEGEWLIEGWGVEPDVVVDNLPHATFGGDDAQLDAAVDYLLRKIEQEPVLPPVAPAHPDKSGAPTP